jgi:hypothetical protein
VGEMAHEQTEEGHRRPLMLAARQKLPDRLLERCERGLALALAEEKRSLGQHKRGPVGPQRPGQRGQPSGRRHRCRRADHRLGERLDGVDCTRRLAGLEVVADRLGGLPRALPHGSGAPMKLGQALRLTLAKAPAQEGLEERW